MATDVLREFMVRLGFAVDDASYRKFQDSVKRVTDQVQEIGAVVTAVAGAITAMVEKSARDFESLFFFARRAGTTVASLQELQYIAKQAGMGVNDLAQMTQQLFDRIVETGGGVAVVLHQMHVNTTEMVNGVMKMRDTKDILLDVAKSFHDLYESGQAFIAIKYGEQLGYSADQVVKLATGYEKMAQASKDYAEIIKNAGLTPTDIEKMGQGWENTATKLNKFLETLKLFYTLFATRLEPAFNGILDFLTQAVTFLNQMDKATDGVSTEIFGFGLTLLGVVGVIETFIGFLKLFGLAAGAAALPVAGWVLLIGLLLIGLYEIIQHWPELKKAMGDGLDWVNDKLNWVNDRANEWGAKLMQALKDGVDKAWPGFRQYWEKKWDEWTSWMPGWLKTMMFSDVGKGFDQLRDAAKGGSTGGATGNWGDTAPDTRNWFDKAYDWLFPPAAAGTIPQGGVTPMRGGAGRPAGVPPGRQANRANIEKAMRYFMTVGHYTAAQAAGIVANLLDESAMNPKAVNPQSGAYGIAQWLGSRYTQLVAFARSMGKSPDDLDTQLAFIMWELGNTELSTGTALHSATNPSESSDIFGGGYERYGYVPGRPQHSAALAEGLATTRLGTGGAPASVTLNANTNINVTGTTEPQAVARETARQQSRVMGDAVRNLSSAVDTHVPAAKGAR